MTGRRSRFLSCPTALACAALLVALVLVPATAASAGPLLPITPVFPPWILHGLTTSLPATITGYVKNESASPIASVTVEVYGETSSTAVEAQNFVQRAVTDATGKFVITDVIQGTYSMLLNSPDLTPTVFTYREESPWHDEYGGPGNTQHLVLGGSTVDVGDVTLKYNASVSGRALAGATPVPNSQVVAEITDPGTGVVYTRWSETGADGRFTIPNAPPGDWSLQYSGAGTYVPIDSQPGNWDGGDYDPITVSAPELFSVTEGDTVNRTAHQFETGQLVVSGNWESSHGSSYNVGGMWATATSTLDPSVAYHWTTGDDGWARLYLPPGEFDFGYSDSLSCYQDLDVGTFATVSGGTTLNVRRQLTPADGTYAVYGHISEAGTPGSNVASWIAMTRVDPDNFTYPDRRVVSNGSSDSDYLIRLPADTGFAGNHVLLVYYDQTGTYPSTTMPLPPVHLPATYTATGPSDIEHDVAVTVGGSISGTVTDDHGNPVIGVTVSAQRKGIDPSMDPAATTWLNSFNPISDAWVAMTDASGHYTLTGLPTDTDYKVIFNPDYNPGWPLPIAYKDYNRRVYMNRQLADGLNAMVSPPVVDHDPVSVLAGGARTGIDTQLRPGGYVALHADGPAYPTGAVYCDVMYQVSGAWSEVDSGFTTGGTFQKLWKVLPAGNYRLDYSDYFGRGAGSWAFALAEGEHKYTSILVPAPLTLYSGAANLSGTFAGMIGNGAVGGGAGGAQLNVVSLPSVSPTAPPPPPNYISAGGIYDFSSTGTTLSGVWTLTMPYSASVPDGDVGSLRIRHLKTDGTVEILTPMSWNTTLHTLQVQTTSLSPFQVMFTRTTVTLGTPSTPTKLSHTKSFTILGTLSPKHKAGVKSVQVAIYRRGSHNKFKLYKTVWTKNYDYRSITQYRVTLKLGKGVYRLYAIAPADPWHLKTTTRGYRQITVK